MAEDLMDNGTPEKIGGPGHIVEIDESKFGKRKYHRRRRVVGKWLHIRGAGPGEVVVFLRVLTMID